MDASQPRNLAPAVLPGLKHKLRWRLNRLRCMSATEVAFRLVRALQAHAERSGLMRESDIPAPALAGTPQAWLKVPKLDSAPYVAAANRIADGYLEVFALERVHMGWPPRWNRDPKTGVEAPLVYGKLLDYRDADLVGDIKYLWEPNRHLHFVTLAQAYALTQERRFCDVLAEHLESWFLSCPFGYGPNWASALEAAMRLINWSATWQLVGGFEAPMFARHPELRLLWLRSVYEHVEFIRGWYSRHSSANNHLIGEAAGVFIAALTWPYWPRMRRAAAQAKGILESEMLAQNAPDGVNREQAVAYQHFELDLLVLCLLAGKANRQWFSPAYESRLEAMFDYLASIMDCAGNVPMFGDSDDGCALRLAQEPSFSPYRSLLATGAILFRRGDFKLKSARLDDKTRWLLGAEADSCYAALDAEKTRLPPRQAFHDGGYYILGCEFETPNEIRVLADAGPLGYRSIAAHGHADALSFTLSAVGREFFIDPGTYAYHTQAHWRQYFRGTGAHNAVRIDGLDQSVPGGSFMWVKHARAGCSLWLSSAEKDTFEGWHDGYMRLEDPVKHRRLIELDKLARRIVIEDTLDMNEEHDVELFFHCSERCSVDPAGDEYIVSNSGLSVRLTLPRIEQASVRVYTGNLSPLAGWVSRAFDVRQAAPTIAWQARLGGRVVLRTEIAIPLGR